MHWTGTVQIYLHDLIHWDRSGDKIFEYLQFIEFTGFFSLGVCVCVCVPACACVITLSVCEVIEGVRGPVDRGLAGEQADVEVGGTADEEALSAVPHYVPLVWGQLTVRELEA